MCVSLLWCTTLSAPVLESPPPSPRSSSHSFFPSFLLLFSFPLISHSLLFLPPCHFDFPIHWPVLHVYVCVSFYVRAKQTVKICLHVQPAVVGSVHLTQK